MKLGKVSQTVMRRSMLKPLQFHREETLFAPTAEEMCYGITQRQGQQQVLSSITLAGDEKDLGLFALAHVVNDLASRMAETVGVQLQLTLPPYAYESRLKAMMEQTERAGSTHGVQILGAKAEVCSGVSTTIWTMNGVGVQKKGALKRSSMAKAEQDLVLAGYIGLEGTLRILRKKEEALRQRFIPAFLRETKELEEKLFIDKALLAVGAEGISAIHPLGSGGILAGLWELAESADIGLLAELKKMNIRQETVEICEFSHVNPYQLTSTGCALLVAEDGEAVCEKLENLGVPSAVIGRTTCEKKRILTGGEEVRFLDRPAPDEWNKICEEVSQ